MVNLTATPGTNPFGAPPLTGTAVSLSATVGTTVLRFYQFNDSSGKSLWGRYPGTGLISGFRAVTSASTITTGQTFIPGFPGLTIAPSASGVATYGFITTANTVGWIRMNLGGTGGAITYLGAAFNNTPGGSIGAGQVSAVHGILLELGVEDVPMVGVAKGVDRDAGKEEFHRFGGRPFALRRGDPVLYFVQRMRDEAHRFAIGAHRAKRAKAVGATPLDEVPGVGATRKRALLSHFGSAKAVSRAALTDLKAVEGISDTLAETIYDFFHEKG